jgi:NADH:ubiquinone oxidoreductase subunit 5 (subunit L)/multisubunit Na+/H+ antiporter MnhA subunit
MPFSDFTWLIPLLPIIGLLFVAAFGKKTPEGGGYFAVGGIAAAMVVSLLVAFEFLTGNGQTIVNSQTWIDLGGGRTFEVGYYVDALTAIMLIVVSILCTLILVYSLGYMHEEGERKRRYYVEMSLFVTGMLGLVVASNYLEMFIFWEIMGLCSYLLIGFWYYKPSAARAAKKAFMVTRVGDILLMIGIISLFASFGSLNYRDLFDPAFFNAHVDYGLLTFSMFCVFGGAIGKSAQFPLHDWLPDAMEGPTTVSALIHAATMVKAGVFLVARSFPLMVHSPDVLLLIAAIGGFTALYAATMALNNPNIKRVLAYSTISQLGYMFLALGAGGYLIATAVNEAAVAEGNVGFMAAMFHLMNHAFFKALLFLGAGAVIHAVHTEDMRLMGGLSKKLKITSFVMLIGALSIAGIPPLSGFWSKDEVLSAAYSAGSANAGFYILYIMGVATAFLTAFYMFRLWFMTFTGKEGESAHHAHESPRSMTVPLIILAIFAFASGFIILGPGGGLPAVAQTGNVHGEVIAGETLGLGWISTLFTEWQTYLSIAVALGGLGLAYAAYYKGSISLAWATKGANKKVYDLLLNRYYFPRGYDGFGYHITYGVARVVDWFDVNIIDGAVNGISWVAVHTGARLRKIQTGRVQTYAGVILLALTVLLLLIYLFGGLR